MPENSESSNERTAGETTTTREEVHTIEFCLREIQRLLSIRVTLEVSVTGDLHIEFVA